jgi:hypothetical protein
VTIHHCVFGSAGSPTNLYFAKQSKTLLGQEECAFAFCSYNNKLEHRTSSLKSSCRRLQFSQQSFPSFLICKVPQLSVLNKPVGLGQSVCVCVCVCVLLPVWDQRVLLSVGWVFRTGTQIPISVYISAIIMVLNHGCQKSNTRILSFVPFQKKTPKNQTLT